MFVKYLYNKLATESDLLIKLGAISEKENKAFYLKNRKRFATATSVAFVNENTLVAGSYLGYKLYLIRFDLKNKSSIFLDEITTTFSGSPAGTDLCDYSSNGNIIVSNFAEGSCSLYSIVDNKIKFERDIIFKFDSFVHGVKFYKSNIIAATTTRGHVGICFYDLSESKELFFLNTEIKTQDVCFVSDNLLVALISHGAPTSSPNKMYDGEVRLYSFDIESGNYEILKSRRIKNAHIDSVVCHDMKIYITDQYNNKLRVLRADDFTDVKKIYGYDFPHGIAIKNDLLAVSNYGNNTISIKRLN